MACAVSNCATRTNHSQPVQIRHIQDVQNRFLKGDRLICPKQNSPTGDHALVTVRSTQSSCSPKYSSTRLEVPALSMTSMCWIGCLYFTMQSVEKHRGLISLSITTNTRSRIGWRMASIRRVRVLLRQSRTPQLACRNCLWPPKRQNKRI